MSAEAMSACPNHTDPGNSEVPHPSFLWNAMIEPFTPMVIASFLWWQGESNAWTVANAEEYGCNQKAMIGDLRARFSNSTTDGDGDAVEGGNASSSPPLPFIFMQSFPLFGNLSKFQPFSSHFSGSSAGTVPDSSTSLSSAAATQVLAGLSELRLAQAESLALPGVGMACTIDLGCPFTWQHNRAKRPCAHRAVLAARALVYHDDDGLASSGTITDAAVGSSGARGSAPASPLVFRGPEPKDVQILPIECSHGGCGAGSGHQYVEFALRFEMFGSAGFHHHQQRTLMGLPLSVLSFEVLFADRNATNNSPARGRTSDSIYGGGHRSGSPAAGPPSGSFSTSESAWVPASLLPVDGNSVRLNGEDTIGIGATAYFTTYPVPLAIRYAHGDFPTGILHNAEGLPMAPFVLEL